MARVATLPLSEWRSDLREMVGGDAATIVEQGLMRVLSHNPDLAKGVLGFGTCLYQSTSLSRRLVELVRLRVAFHNQCRSCMAIRYADAVADGLSEDLVCSLAKPHEADNLSDAEKSAIRFGELMASTRMRPDSTCVMRSSPPMPTST